MHAAASTTRRWLLECAAIACLYAVTAQLGFLLAIPPGNVTVLWPPSGLALAALLLLGNGRAAGVWLGSFLVNLTFLDGGPAASHGDALATAAGIATASTAQALVAALGVRRCFGMTLPVTTSSVATFAVVIALTCVIGASGGVGSLYAIGAVDTSELANTWQTWWLGDLAGILVVTPILVVAVRRRQTREPWLHAAPFPTGCLGVGLSLILFSIMSRAEDVALEARLDGDARSLAGELQRGVDRGVEEVEMVAALLQRIDTVDAKRFHDFTAPQLARNRSISALSWVPRIEHADRLAYEARYGRRVTELDASGRRVSAAQRDAYFPVTWIVPVTGHDRALGYDINSEGVRADAIERVEASGRAATTGPVRLVQEPADQSGFLILSPVRTSGQSGREIAGLASGVFVARLLLDEAASLVPNVDVHVFDDIGTGSLVTSTARHGAGEASHRSGLAREQHVDLPGRRWTVVIRPRQEYLAAERTALPWVLLSVGLLLTGLLLGYFRSSRRVETELRSARNALRRELAERERVQRELGRTEQRLHSVAESTTDAIVIADEHRLICSWNAGARTIFGYAAEEVLGRPFTLLLPERHRQSHGESFGRQDATAVDALGRTIEVHGLRKSGAEFPVELSLVRWTEGEHLMFGGIMRDATERKQLEEAVRQSRKMEAVGRLAGGVAHDFNNLLTVILGSTEQALLDTPDGTPVSAALVDIRDAGERAASLTRQLLAFGRKQLLSPVTLDLGVLIGDLARMLRRLISEDIAVAIATPVGLGRVRADPTQLQQVVVNLVVNARDAMPTGGQLTISVSAVTLAEDEARCREVAPGRYVRLSIGDTGSGMDEATAARVFEPFFTTKGPGKGTGLGLATVWGIVRQSGGCIELTSAVAVGTTFTVHLPCVDEAPPAAAVVPKDAAPELPRRTVLLVEDEEVVRRLARRILERRGHRVLEACDGQTALTLLDDYDAAIDLLVTDVVMPGMSGRRLASEVLQRRPSIRVLYISGYTDDALGRHGLLDEGLVLLSKPFTPAALVEKVDEMLKQVA